MKIFQTTFMIIWTLIACVPNMLAQNARFDHFDTRNGLPQNNVYSLVVDSTGYIWIGTLEGLTRFDGKEFKIVHSSPGNTNSLQGSQIDELSACPNGNLWILTRQGEMRLYDASMGKFIFFKDSCFYPSRADSITSMVSASDSSLWFTENKGLYRFNLPNRKTTKYNVPFWGGFIQAFGEDGLLYWGQGGIFLLEPGLSEGRNLQQLYSKPVQTISRVFNDSLLVVCSDSVLIFNLEQKKTDVLTANNRLKEALKNTRIISAAGYKDEIWLGLSDGLVLIQHQNGVQDVSKFTYDPYNNHSFHGKDAKSLAFDRAGNLWIGTSKYGISLYGREKNLFKHHQISVLSKADQEIDPVRSLCKTRDGSVWVGFDRSGLVRTSPDNQQILYNDIHFPNGKTSPIARVRSLHEDSRGNLWIGTNQGLCIYNPDLNVVEAVSLAFGWEWPSACYFMKEFDSGKLTITNNQGIGIVDLQKKTLRELPFPDNQLSPIRSMVRDKDNNYWIILDNIGLFKLSPDYKITNFNSEPNYLTNSKLYTLEITSDILWIASSSGLLAFDLNTEKVVSTYHESDGLSNNLVYGIIADADYLWLSTNRGLSRMTLTNKHFESFLPDDLFMDDAYYKDNKGVIYFGGYDGYIDLNPQTFQREQIVPKPILTQLSLNNQWISVGDQVNDKTILPVSLQKMNLLQMDYGPSSFSLAFDAFPFNYPDRTYFRYRLNGLSPEWMYAANNENRAVFANLDPGNYDFEVEASLNGKNWSKPTTLSVEIIPPFWQEPWFEIMLVVTLLILGIALFQMRVYAIKRWNNQLKSKVAEQTQSIEKQKNKIIAQKEKMVELSNRLHEADQAKLNFYTNVSHEFRTPLTIIMGNLETLKDQGVSQLLLRNIKRSTERLFRLVNQFIDLRKYDKGELKLAISRVDIVSFTRDILESFQELANRQNIHLSLEKSEEKIFLWLDQDKTDKILYNLLSNAIKYTDSEGSVHVSFFQKQKGLELRITDTGRGISEEDQLNIFNGFFRGKETSYLTDGHGIGLSLVKALVDIQKAEIGCTSKIGSGTSFHILFKWGNLHFNEEDIAEDEEIPFLHETETLPIPEIISTNLLGEEILLVEDNPELLDFLSTLLGKYYKIQTAANGKDALMKITNNTPDLIITDLMMPRMDGIEFCKAVRERLETRFIPIIILSAKTDVSSKMEGYQINIDDYIEKPFHPSLLLTRISSVLNKRQEIRKNIDNLILIPQDKHLRQKTDKIFLEKVLVILELHYSDPDFSINNLSSEMGMSRVTFYRKIKKISGEGPGEFIRKFRMKKAATLLQGNSKTIGEVCSDVGFQSLPHFRKNFKQEFGVLPSKYL